MNKKTDVWTNRQKLRKKKRKEDGRMDKHTDRHTDQGHSFVCSFIKDRETDTTTFALIYRMMSNKD